MVIAKVYIHFNTEVVCLPIKRKKKMKWFDCNCGKQRHFLTFFPWEA